MRSLTGILAASAVVATCFASTASAQIDRGSARGASVPPADVLKDSRLDSQLAAVATAAERGNAAGVQAARSRGLEVSSAKVQVIVEAAAADASSAVTTLGGSVEGVSGELTEALVPATAVRRLAGARGVDYVRTPFAARVFGIDSEGVASSAASAWHVEEIKGAGAKVAIIDLGFEGLAARQASGDLPALTIKDYCGGTMGAPEKHGTAVAEIVYEMAPAAQLYAICVDSEVDLAIAAAYAKANGITIVNHSVGWYNTSRGDGTGAAGTPDAIVAAARADGILWVNAAGNAAQEHWSGTYSDPDGDERHNFSGSDEGNSLVLYPGEEVCGFLKWDAWPTTRQDFDLYLVNEANEADNTASQDDQQNGPLPPTEGLCYTNLNPTAQVYSLRIEKWSATTSPRFDLFVTIGDALQFENAAGSVVEPATSPSALAVGAVHWSDDGLEPYSSVGPTIDGRIKPDLAAASAVTSAIYAPFTFTGTSSAAPHVAGAAALLRGMFPLATADALQAFLEEEAPDLGVAGKDSFYGAGVLLLPAAAPFATTFAPAAGPTATDSLAVSGSLSPRGVSTDYYWEYGATAAYGSQTATLALASPRADQELSATLTGLTPDTEYHYRLVATNTFGTTEGADRTNRTAVTAAPLATTSASEVVGSSQARLAGRVTPNGTASTAWFEWGTTISYGAVTADQSVGALGEFAVVAEIAGLQATTQYHYRLVAENAYGGPIVGADQVFTTTGATTPFATTGTAAALGTNAITLNGDVTPGGLATTYQFQYRPVGSTTAPIATPVVPADAGYGTDAHGVTSATATVSPNFPYEYRLVATNGLGSYTGQYRSFTISPPAPTPPPPPPPSGGGSGGSLNLGVTLSAAKTTLVTNETVEIRALVTHKSGNLSALQVRALIALPPGSTLAGPPAFDRGSGCTGTVALDCYLDFLPAAASTLVRFSINVGAAGTKTVTARVTQSATDTDANDNSASVSLQIRVPVTPTPPATGSAGSQAPAAKVVTGTNRANTLNGSAGREVLRGLGGNDKLFGRGGDDRLFGGSGNDRLVGGPGKDVLDAGAGKDRVESRDSTRDVVRCGAGKDTVIADRLDWVARDCELVRRR